MIFILVLAGSLVGLLVWFCVSRCSQNKRKLLPLDHRVPLIRPVPPRPKGRSGAKERYAAKAVMDATANDEANLRNAQEGEAGGFETEDMKGAGMMCKESKMRKVTVTMELEVDDSFKMLEAVEAKIKMDVQYRYRGLVPTGLTITSIDVTGKGFHHLVPNEPEEPEEPE